MRFKILPSSFFGRNSLTIAVLLIISQTISFFTVQNFIVERKNETIMYLVTNQIKLQFLGQESDIPKSLSVGFSETTELELFYITSGPLPNGLETAEDNIGFTRAAEEYLGEGTQVKVETSDRVYVWVNEPNHSDYWARMPIAETDLGMPISFIIFSGVLLMLSLLGAWLLVHQLHRPLKRLAFAAREIGRGDFPGKLKEVGPQELVAVTSAFNQMAADVHQLEEDRTLLLAGISHDLRTPITRIRLASEFLPEEEDEIKQGLIADAQDMDDIIDQFIGYVRYGSEEAMEIGDVNDLIQQVIEAAGKQHEGITSDLKPIKKMPIKPLAMKRLISNLIENAFRYGKAPVVVSSFADESVLRITVRDHGSGIQDLDKARLFQPFARGDKARGGKGSGLGLAIVQRIAEMHKGNITLNNHPDGGLEASFIMKLGQNK